MISLASGIAMNSTGQALYPGLEMSCRLQRLVQEWRVYTVFPHKCYNHAFMLFAKKKKICKEEMISGIDLRVRTDFTVLVFYY